MNASLYQFICEFREPATTAELWAELSMVAKWSKAADLPASHQELADELRLLLVGGYLACDGGLWRPVPRKVERRVEQRSLFA